MRTFTKINISQRLLDRATSFFDKLTGSLDPSARNITIYGDNGIKMIAGDGILTGYLIVDQRIKRRLPPYILPLDAIKQLKGASDKVEIVFNDEIELSIGTERLKIKRVKGEKAAGIPHFIRTHSIKTSSFINNIDFSTIHLLEGEETSILIAGERLISISESNGHVACAISKMKGQAESCFSLPYASSRHLVKALSLLKIDELEIGNADGLPAIKAGGLIVSIDGEKRDGPSVLKKVEGLFSSSSDCQFFVEMKELKGAISRAARIQRLFPSVARLFLYADRIEVIIKQPSLFYATSARTILARNPKDYAFTISPLKLLSLLKRIGGEKAVLTVLDSGLLLKRGNMRAILITQK